MFDPEHEQAELLAIVMAGPDPEKDGFSAFTRDDLAHQVGIVCLALREATPLQVSLL